MQSSPNKKTSENAREIGIPLLSDKEMDIFRELIYEECGIDLKESKRSMMSSRLYKRLRTLGLENFQDYYNYIASAKDRIQEIISMIDVITTNKTDFFRESNHFDLFVNQALPRLTAAERFQKQDRLHFWSAGCSSGEEPYTLAMILDDYFQNRRGSYSILATDISTRVLMAAKRAVYPEETIAPVPAHFRKKYMMQGKGDRKGQYRIVPELRKKVVMGRLNFMDEDFGIKTLMDAIFCRNVIIYFDWQTKVRLIKKLYRQLHPGGYLFVGHSETLNSVDLTFERLAPTVFRKPEETETR